MKVILMRIHDEMWCLWWSLCSAWKHSNVYVWYIDNRAMWGIHMKFQGHRRTRTEKFKRTCWKKIRDFPYERRLADHGSSEAWKRWDILASDDDQPGEIASSMCICVWSLEWFQTFWMHLFSLKSIEPTNRVMLLRERPGRCQTPNLLLHSKQGLERASVVLTHRCCQHI